MKATGMNRRMRHTFRSLIFPIFEGTAACSSYRVGRLLTIVYAPLGGGQEQARGPHHTKVDLAVLKDFPIVETVRLEFRAEAFNTANTPPFAQSGNLNFTNLKAGFSNITSTKNSNPNNEARTPQFALKLFY